MLSIIAVLFMLVTGWLGWEMVYRRRVAIADAEDMAAVQGRHAPDYGGYAHR